MNQDVANSELIEFSRKLRRMRVERGISQEKLAEDAGVDIRSIQRFEAGEINIVLTTLIHVRKALGCKWDDLLPKDD